LAYDRHSNQSNMSREDPDRVATDRTADLLARGREGDRDALDQLFARHIPLLRRWASGRLPRWARDIADTPDLVQETAFQTFTHLDTFEPRGDGALQAYLRQALVNRIRNELRRAATRPAPAGLDSAVPANDTSPYEAAIARETSERYEAGLAQLNPEERDAIVTRVEFGLSYAEVAEALGKPSADAARMAVVRALVKLAKSMNGVT
jgi:RNA polymerase sigma-70 factor (ECF subfamily)